MKKKPFGNLFKKKGEKAPSTNMDTGWENMEAEVPFNQAEEARKQNTARQQNKIIAALTRGNIGILNEHTAEVSHAARQDFLDEVASGNIGNEHWNYVISSIADIGNKRGQYTDAIKQLEKEALAPRVSGDPYEVNGKEYILTPESLAEFGLSPNSEMYADGKLISFSKMYKTNNHLACTAYVSSAEGTKICSYYRSNSSGSWRYLPEYTDEGHWFGKGYNEESLTLPFEFQERLTELSTEEPLQLDPVLADFAFFGTAKRYHTKDEWIRTKKEKSLRGVHYKESSNAPSYSLSPEVNLYSRPAPETVGLELMNSPYGPNYQEEISSYEMHTDLYGDVTVKAYPSGNGELRYTMCEVNHNGERQAWISSVESTNKVTAVGTPTKWVSSGVLATPLYEYGQQANGYGDKSDTRGSYESMWKGYISKIPLIQKYMQETEQK